VPEDDRDRRWPSTEAHIFQDRHGQWRARVCLSIGGQVRMFYVPARTETGAASRLQLLLRVETVLDDIGVLFGFTSDKSATAELARTCTERDDARAELTRFQLAIEQAACDTPGIEACVFFGPMSDAKPQGAAAVAWDRAHQWADGDDFFTAEARATLKMLFARVAARDEEEIRPFILRPKQVRGILDYVRSVVRSLGDWSAYDRWHELSGEVEQLRARCTVLKSELADARQQLQDRQ
jgi:hypothetical protein